MTPRDVAALATGEAAALHEQQILAEQSLAESRAILEHVPEMQAKSMGFFSTLTELRDKSKCGTCGKTRLVLNAARRGYRPETVTLATHCACPGGPAHHLLSSAGSGAES